VTKNDDPEPLAKRKRGRPPGPKKTGAAQEQVLFVRAPLQLIQRIDAHLDRLKQRNPSFRLHRSDVVRTLVERAIALEEHEARVESDGIPRDDLSGVRDAGFSLTERHVLEAIRASVNDADARARLVDVYARCRGISRREYEEGIRALERAGHVTMERAVESAGLSDAERAAAIIDHRGTIVTVSLRAPASETADNRRTAR
jgi:hypothetical protein